MRPVGHRLAIAALLCSSLSIAAPPDPPVNETPSDGMQEVAAHPVLCVDVSDPDGEAVNVSFFGRRVTGKDFTVIALPDTQYYSQDYPGIYQAQSRWIAEQQQARNIVFVTHLGDIVQDGDDTVEWDNADFAMSYLDGIPYGVAPGNHDQDPRGIPRTNNDEGGTTVLFNQYFGVRRFDGRDFYGGHYDFGDPGSYPENNDNNYQLFSAGGMDFIVIHLEFDMAPSPERNAVLSWLDNLLMTYPDRRAVIMTHYMIGPVAMFSDQGQAIYDMVKDNPNVFLLLGGHVHGAARRTDEFQGNTIHSLLADYQGLESGGNGYLRIMTFSPENDEIRVETYSPWLDQYDRSEENDFSLDYTMAKPVRFEQIGIRAYQVPSGDTACAPWTGRRAGLEYEWYVRVESNAEVTFGPRWTFGSNGACDVDGDCKDRDPCTEDTCTGGTCDDTGLFDGDFDSVCENLDNCPGLHNPLQVDSDDDGRGDLCDACAQDFDPGQYDSDGDGSGDACDCQSWDSRDLAPGSIGDVQAGRSTATGITLTWAPALGADAYSVSRGDLADLGPDNLGACFGEGIAGTSLEDPEVPLSGQGWFYLVQGQNFDCGVGAPGYGPDESVRVNRNPDACIGHPAFDDRAVADEPVYGTVDGSLTDTYSSDDSCHSIRETTGGEYPGSRLEHRWTLEVTGGDRIELHLEGYRKESKDGDEFVFEYSTDNGASWLPIDLVSPPTNDIDVDLVADLPAHLAGEILIRVVDTDRTPGNIPLDWVRIDELFIRSIP